MLRHGARPDLPCGTLQMTPLHMAVFNHNALIVHLLLEAGAPTNVLDNWNYTPLMYACVHHDPTIAGEIIKHLLEFGANPNFGATLCSETRLFELPSSEVNSDLPMLRSSYNGDVFSYTRVPMGPTSGSALHIAVQNPHLGDDIIEMLLETRAEVDKLNLHGQTPLMGAILDVYYDYHRNVKSHAQLLLSRGASPDVCDVRGWSSFHYAVQRGSLSAMSLLMDWNCSCEIVNTNLESPLWLLLAHGWREAAKFLICSGCNLNRPIRSMILLSINQNIELCRYGPIYPLEFAVCNYFYDLAELMVDLGCEISNETWLGRPKKEQYKVKHAALMRRIERRFEQRQKVRSLQYICRGCIRRCLRNNVCSKVKHLSLPAILKDYLCYMPLSSIGNIDESCQNMSENSSTTPTEAS